MKRSTLIVSFGAVALLCAGGCLKTQNEVEIKPVEVEVKPIEIKPIQISLDVRVKVEEELKKETEAASRRGNDPLYQRVREREPQLQLCLAEGLVGEGNQGLLVNRLEAGDSRQAMVQLLVDAENRDRETIMERIADRQKLSDDEVHAGWTVRAAEHAKAGTWIQDAEGKWYQK